MTGENAKKPSNMEYGRKTKAKVYLRYSLLVDLMQIVKTYGRKDNYKFENDEKLACLKSGEFGYENQNDKTRLILSIDSFMTIWLLTLPEKFQ